jgi:hypothetical protein
MPRTAARPIAPPLPTAPLIVSAHEAQIIAALRAREAISRTDLARLTGWSRPKVTVEVGKLAKRNLLVESGEGVSQGGRRPRLLKFNHQLGYIVGVDLGATSLDIAVADLNAQVLLRDSGPADVRDEPLDLLGEAKRRVLALLARCDIRPERVVGVGVGVPGPVDFLKGVLVAPPLMPAWEGFSIRGYFHPIFPSAFIAVDNDVNIMALGELKSGVGMGQDDFIFVKIGTGTARIVCNGVSSRSQWQCGRYRAHLRRSQRPHLPLWQRRLPGSDGRRAGDRRSGVGCRAAWNESDPGAKTRREPGRAARRRCGRRRA